MDFQALAALSIVVARELTFQRDGESWLSLEGDNSGQRKLRTPEGDNLTMVSDRGRLTIAGWFPATAMPNTKRHSITVDETRDAEAIAGEISRRLVPGYREELRQVIDYNARCIADHHGRAAVLRELAEAMGGTYRTPEYSLHRDSQVLHLSKMPGSIGGSIEATGTPDSVDMTLRNVPAPLAARMLALLGEATRVGPAHQAPASPPELAYSGISQRGDSYATAENFVSYLAGVMQADNGLDDYSGQAEGDTLVVLAHDLPVFRAEFRCAIEGCTEHEAGECQAPAAARLTYTSREDDLRTLRKFEG